MISGSPRRLSEYWDWFAVALFILISVDLLTTRFAAYSVGLEAEMNPLVRWALHESIGVLVLVNLVAACLAIGSFYILMQMLRSSPSPYDGYLALGIEVWLGIMIGTGLFIFANNLAVVVHGRSLIGFG